MPTSTKRACGGVLPCFPPPSAGTGDVCLVFRLPELRKAWFDQIEAVRTVEYDYVGLQRERARVSPRAVEQGWVEELDKNVDEHRVLVTDAKMKALFQHAKPLRVEEEAKHRVRSTVRQWQWQWQWCVAVVLWLWLTRWFVCVSGSRWRFRWTI